MVGDVLAIALGLGVGLSLGALGGGGSTLAVPILVFVAGVSAQDATTASLLVVGIAALIGVVGHHRDGHVRLGTGVAFGLAGILGSRLGTVVNHAVSEQVLLLGFSVLIMFVAIRMYRRATTSPGVDVDDHDERDGRAEGLGAIDPPRGAEGTVLVVGRPRARLARRRARSSPAAMAKLALAATAVGFLTGLFGVGGGFAVVPALTLLLAFETKDAIGTSLVVIAVNAAMALAMRAGTLDFDWGLVVPFLVTVSLGVVIGTRVARVAEADKLTRSFAMLLAVIAVYTAVSTLAT